jgi:hypothetical protein
MSAAVASSSTGHSEAMTLLQPEFNSLPAGPPPKTAWDILAGSPLAPDLGAWLIRCSSQRARDNGPLRALAHAAQPLGQPAGNVVDGGRLDEQENPVPGVDGQHGPEGPGERSSGKDRMGDQGNVVQHTSTAANRKNKETTSSS